jgi:hypothetical protein
VDFPHVDVRSEGNDGLDLPRPIRSGLPLVVAGVLPLALGLADVIRPLSGVVFAATFVAAGVLRMLLAYQELVSTRRRADRDLRTERQPYLHSSPAEWRAGELTSDRHRMKLARAVERTERDLSPAKLPGASPLNRVALRPHVDLLRELAARLRALDRPIPAWALLQVEDLLTSGESPFYARERAGDVRSALRGCLTALEAESLEDIEAGQPGSAVAAR